ncbi:Heterokaryon incompatibility protein (HET) domain containing protein [Naviculisporaceae sp. PSN 640]
MPRDFRHNPLSTRTPQIRLVKLQGRNPLTGRISCRIYHFGFSRKPAYHALSYHWGTAPISNPIELNGRIFHVGANLLSFLTHALLNGINEETYLWIDQLCIDQSKNAFLERNDQVSRMDKIYSEAYQVHVWLGDGDPVVQQFMNRVSTGQYSRERVTRDVGIEGMLAELNAFHTLSYWQRAWVVQEMFLAKRLVFTYGTTTVSLGRILHALKELFTWGTSYPGVHPTMIERLKDDVSEYLQDLSGLTIASFLMRQQCKEVHDRVYAFQGLLPKKARVQVSYEITPTQLFNRVMDRIVRDGNGKSWTTDIHTFACYLDVQPSDFSITLRRLNQETRALAPKAIVARDECYRRWAPRLNPACRKEDSVAMRIGRLTQDAWDLLRHGQTKPSPPSVLTWDDLVEDIEREMGIWRPPVGMRLED